MGKPAPCVRAFVDAIDEVVREHSSGQGLSAIQRGWLAFCLTAMLVTNSICWARCERASLGAQSLAALSGMFRHAKRPWEQLLVASVRMLLRHYGLTSGSLVIDETDKQRSKAAKTSAHWYKRRDHESGGYIWGQRLVFLLLVPPTISIPVGVAVYQPAPEPRAGSKQERRLKEPGVPTTQRPPKPPANPQYPTKPELAVRLLQQCKEQHSALSVHGVVADALQGPSTFVDAASAIFDGRQVITQVRRNQKIRVYKRAQHVADSFAAHPGTPQTIRLRGGEEMVAIVGSARVYVQAHHTKRCIMALQDAGEETYRYLLAADLTWRTLDMVQAHTWRWLVEVFVQDWKAPEGWSQLTKPPGEEGACRSMIPSRLVDHGLFCHPDQHAQLSHNLPAYTVGSLRANGQVECLVDVIQELGSSDDPQSQRHHFTQALREVFVIEHSKKHLAQPHLGRLEPTPYVKYRAAEVMRTMPVLST